MTSERCGEICPGLSCLSWLCLELLQDLERECSSRDIAASHPCICSLLAITTQHNTLASIHHPGRLRLSPRSTQIAPRLRHQLPSSRPCAPPQSHQSFIHEARDTSNTRPLLRCLTPSASKFPSHPSTSLSDSQNGFQLQLVAVDRRH